MALAALEDVLARCHHGPVEHSAALRLVLAYLASRSRGDRWPFDVFWQSVDGGRAKERWSSANAALNGIYLALGRKRDMAVVSRYESAARKRLLEGSRDHASD
jgi:hypothetical protein